MGERYMLQVAAAFLGTLVIMYLAWNPTGFSKERIQELRERFFKKHHTCIPRLLRVTRWWWSLARVGGMVLLNGPLCQGAVKSSIPLEGVLLFLMTELLFIGVTMPRFQKSLRQDLKASEAILQSLEAMEERNRKTPEASGEVVMRRVS